MTSSTPTLQADVWGLLCLGAAIGFLFCAIANGSIGGVLVLYAPSLLLFALGFARGHMAMSFALASSSIVIGLMLGFKAVMVFLGTFGLPIWLLLALISPQSSAGNQPLPHALSWLAFYAAAAMFALLIQPDIAARIHTHFVNQLLIYYQARGLETAELISIKQTLVTATPLIFAAIGWLWVVSIYLLAALANYLLPAVTTQRVFLPSLTNITPLPGALLVALTAACILALFAPSDHLKQLGQALSLLLMMPLFWLGTAGIHQKLQAKQATKAIYVLLYLITFIFLPFSLLIFLAFGLIIQLKASLPTAHGA